MDLFNEIHKAIYELDSLNSKRENIKITTSFLTKRLFQEAINNYPSYQIATINEHASKIFGIEISFNHFSNDIVIYDKTIACIDERLKITITPYNKFVTKI